MLRELFVSGLLIFLFSLVGWLIVPAMFGSFNTTTAIPITVAQIVMMILPIFLIMLVGVILLKARGD